MTPDTPKIAEQASAGLAAAQLKQKKHLQEKMSSSKDSAQRKFWQIPELIEYMLPFLDGESIVNLAKAHPLTNMVLKNRSKMRSKMWEGFVNQIGEPWWDEESDIKHLNALLQMMGLPETLLLDLLHGICKEFKPNENWERGDVLVSCPCPMAFHSVAPRGFLILESVEGAMGTIIQKVSSISIEYVTGDYLGALAARTRRQPEMVVDAYFNVLFCKDQDTAEDAQALLMRCHRVEIPDLSVTGDIGANGWAALAEALQRFPGDRGVEVSRQDMLAAGKENLRTIWESLQGENSQWVVKFGNTEVTIPKEFDGGEVNEWGWEKLEQILVMSEEECLEQARESEGEEQE